MTHRQPFDVAIVGGGIAGLSVALRLPEHLRVALFTKGQFGESNTRYAQGGLAVALGEDDSPELHYQDTLAAGAGLCDEEAVRILVEQAPAAVRWLIQMGVQFDRVHPGEDAYATSDGLLLGREGAHCRWRVLHAGGDATGAEIERALMVALHARPSVVLYEETFVTDLLLQGGDCVGVKALDRTGEAFTILAHSTVLANGGAGGLWLHTSNPSGATADGVALAWKAGAAVTDLEFMQFHPTVLVCNGESHLISEAVRGEGAYLRNHAGERFMERYSSQLELAPRDVVARAILSEMLTEEVQCQYLDLRHLPAEKMHARFPTISAICREYGLDLASDLLPIAPAAHYCMGGVMVDAHGQTTVPGLYAVGEVSCTGVHGANRLASNSLLEGLVYGIQIADELSHAPTVRRQQVERQNTQFISLQLPLTTESSSGSSDELTTGTVRKELQQFMWKYVSLCRDQAGLVEALQQVRTLRERLTEKTKSGRDRLETCNMLLVAELVIVAALERQESRGSHWRQDYPEAHEKLASQHYAFQPLRNHPQGLLQPIEESIHHV
ncbi:L-aspartate oxidase [Tengunoibacter tsumagoiensis]|uniref:L-aspartate oxidase n=1 Tax=Tengunoibacter tsumagoiensis TaxID=2014871 RepID=A0A401ZZC9_9CHLR|nr:L-aspartate oxidase [Tengunoibacter tsumagoiensis]GCE12214.1 L-aspartate oxidase [Tengunoibacter tsumagoiensis]